jgi:tRNA (Thr-GGU) A37 N-methylase
VTILTDMKVVIYHGWIHSLVSSSESQVVPHDHQFANSAMMVENENDQKFGLNGLEKCSVIMVIAGTNRADKFTRNHVYNLNALISETEP